MKIIKTEKVSLCDKIDIDLFFRLVEDSKFNFDQALVILGIFALLDDKMTLKDYESLMAEKNKRKLVAKVK